MNTRLSKLDDENGPFSGIILAVAGLVRVNKGDRISHILDPSESLYAVGQGALGIECRESDIHVQELLKALDHADTRLTCLAERALMRTLEGGCTVPIGVNTKLDKENNTLWMHGLVASLDGTNVVEYQQQVSLADTKEESESLAEQLGCDVANTLYKNGADEILKELAHR